VPYAIAEREQLPAFLARVHKKFFTPHVSIIITTLLMLVLTLKSSFVAALTISTIARLVAYGVTCAALPVLRKRTDAPVAYFKLRGGIVIAVAALILSAWLLANSTFTEAWQAAAAGVLGLLIYFVYRTFKPARRGHQPGA
jgi:amino acid transporter